MRSDYNAATLQAFGEISYRIEGEVSTIEPFANLAYVRHSANGFHEDGGSAALSGNGQTSHTGFSNIGMRASQDIYLAGYDGELSGMLGWQHAFGDIAAESTHAFSAGNAFTVTGAPIAKDAILLEAGINLDITEQASLGLSYEGQFGTDVQNNRLNTKMHIRF